MKLQFKPEDFVSPVAPLQHWRKELADQANKRLDEMLSEATVVYGQSNEKYEEAIWTKNLHEADDIKALLINIEPIVKEPCKHEPNIANQKIGGWFCKHCGVELVAEWKVK